MMTNQEARETARCRLLMKTAFARWWLLYNPKVASTASPWTEGMPKQLGSESCLKAPRAACYYIRICRKNHERVGPRAVTLETLSSHGIVNDPRRSR